jgi:hypothetical protein
VLLELLQGIIACTAGAVVRTLTSSESPPGLF